MYVEQPHHNQKSDWVVSFALDDMAYVIKFNGLAGNSGS